MLLSEERLRPICVWLAHAGALPQ